MKQKPKKQKFSNNFRNFEKSNKALSKISNFVSSNSEENILLYKHKKDATSKLTIDKYFLNALDDVHDNHP